MIWELKVQMSDLANDQKRLAEFAKKNLENLDNQAGEILIFSIVLTDPLVKENWGWLLEKGSFMEELISHHIVAHHRWQILKTLLK
ncbi:hypothetical protein [Flammeovirga agarivorans]|uniref:Uncharacterized protein n=1 Tax=Flammeovirga agarivorans TaxID=2726742 RepID=A0A7X8SR64_9BACT|nr:hypothetical protein [Flammeovirga agarivorans]NLR94904.1 hypothetical protein [Flammeovirga agarivorans]